MVLIIRNNRIQSRRHYRIKHLWSGDFDNSRQNSTEQIQKSELDNNMGEEKNEGLRQVKVLGILFLYSVAMFTLPFAAFFATQHIMDNEFHVDRFTNSCASTLAAVITVNLIIWSYAYRAFCEPDDTIKTVETEQQIAVDDKPKTKSDLNLKED